MIALFLATALADAPTVPARSIEWKKRPSISYPDVARDFGMPDAQCRVAIEIDVQGTVTGVAITECDALFHDTIRRAVHRSSIYPYKLDGTPTPIRTAILVRLIAVDDNAPPWRTPEKVTWTNRTDVTPGVAPDHSACRAALSIAKSGKVRSAITHGCTFPDALVATLRTWRAEPYRYDNAKSAFRVLLTLTD